MTGARLYNDVLPCGATPTQIVVAAERANYFRDLWPLSFAYLGLVLLAYMAARHSADPPPVPIQGRRELFALVVGLLGCLPLVVVLVGDFGMSQSQAYTVKLYMGYPLICLTIPAVGALLPYGRLRAAGEVAILTGISVAFSLYGTLALFDRSQTVIASDPTTVKSALSEETASALSNAENYYFAVMFSLAVLWVASRITRRALRRTPPIGNANAHGTVACNTTGTSEDPPAVAGTGQPHT